MYKTYIVCYVSSETLEALVNVLNEELITNVNSSLKMSDIEKTKNCYRLQLINWACNEYDEDHIIESLSVFLNNHYLYKNLTKNDRINIDILIKKSGIDSENESIAGLTFPSTFLSLCASIRINIIVQILLSNAPIKKEESRCGAYYYIASDTSPLDITMINLMTGTLPTVVEHKNNVLKHRISDSNVWGVECFHFNTPNKAIEALIKTVINPKKVGRYVKKEKLNSHIDLTCYGIYHKTTEFVIPHNFLSFCNYLQLKWLDIDIML